MDSKVKKDNLTDLIPLIKPSEKPTSSSEAKRPIVEPPKDLDDYQVTTPDGETITLNKTSIQKSKQGSNIKEILTSKDGKYILVIKNSR